MNYRLVLVFFLFTNFFRGMFLEATEINVLDLIELTQPQISEAVKDYLVKGDPHFLRTVIPPLAEPIEVPSCVSSSAISHDGNRLLLVCNGEAWMLDLENAIVTSRVKLLDPLPDRHLRKHSITNDGVTITSEITPGENLFDAAISDPIREVCLDHAGMHALTRSEKCVKLWNLTNPAAVQVDLLNAGILVSPKSICFSSDANRALVGYDDGSVALWDLNSLSCPTILREHTFPVTSVFLLSNSEWAITQCVQKTVTWNLRDLENIRTSVRQEPPYLKRSRSPDGRWALSIFDNGDLQLLDLTKPDGIYLLPKKCTMMPAKCRLTNEWALISYKNGRVFIHNLADPMNCSELIAPSNKLRSRCLTSDYALLGYDNSLIRWDLSPYRKLSLQDILWNILKGKYPTLTESQKEILFPKRLAEGPSAASPLAARSREILRNQDPLYALVLGACQGDKAFAGRLYERIEGHGHPQIALIADPEFLEYLNSGDRAEKKSHYLIALRRYFTNLSACSNEEMLLITRKLLEIQPLAQESPSAGGALPVLPTLESHKGPSYYRTSASLGVTESKLSSSASLARSGTSASTMALGSAGLGGVLSSDNISASTAGGAHFATSPSSALQDAAPSSSSVSLGVLPSGTSASMAPSGRVGPESGSLASTSGTMQLVPSPSMLLPGTPSECQPSLSMSPSEASSTSAIRTNSAVVISSSSSSGVLPSANSASTIPSGADFGGVRLSVSSSRISASESQSSLPQSSAGVPSSPGTPVVRTSSAGGISSSSSASLPVVSPGVSPSAVTVISEGKASESGSRGASASSSGLVGPAVAVFSAGMLARPKLEELAVSFLNWLRGDLEQSPIVSRVLAVLTDREAITRAEDAAKERLAGNKALADVAAFHLGERQRDLHLLHTEQARHRQSLGVGNYQDQQNALKFLASRIKGHKIGELEGQLALAEARAIDAAEKVVRIKELSEALNVQLTRPTVSAAGIASRSDVDALKARENYSAVSAVKERLEQAEADASAAAEKVMQVKRELYATNERYAQDEAAAAADKVAQAQQALDDLRARSSRSTPSVVKAVSIGKFIELLRGYEAGPTDEKCKQLIALYNAYRTINLGDLIMADRAAKQLLGKTMSDLEDQQHAIQSKEFSKVESQALAKLTEAAKEAGAANNRVAQLEAFSGNILVQEAEARFGNAETEFSAASRKLAQSEQEVRVLGILARLFQVVASFSQEASAAVKQSQKETILKTFEEARSVIAQSGSDEALTGAIRGAQVRLAISDDALLALNSSEVYSKGFNSHLEQEKYETMVTIAASKVSQAQRELDDLQVAVNAVNFVVQLR